MAAQVKGHEPVPGGVPPDPLGVPLQVLLSLRVSLRGPPVPPIPRPVPPESPVSLECPSEPRFCPSDVSPKHFTLIGWCPQLCPPKRQEVPSRFPSGLRPSNVSVEVSINIFPYSCLWGSASMLLPFNSTSIHNNTAPLPIYWALYSAFNCSFFSAILILLHSTIILLSYLFNCLYYFATILIQMPFYRFFWYFDFILLPIYLVYGDWGN